MSARGFAVHMASVRLIDAQQARHYAYLTFPALRFPLLEPKGKDLAIAVALDSGGDAVGLAYGWGGPRQTFELMSIYVTPIFRRHGIGARLLSTVETELAGRGYGLGVHNYTMPIENQGLGYFLLEQGWTRPRVRQLICKGCLEGFCSTAWYRVQTPGGFTLKTWNALTAAERSGIRERTAQDEAWYAHDQDPFVYEIGSHAQTSVALLKDGVVVGWVLTHLPDGADSLRWTVSFVAPELARKGHIVHLWQEAARRQKERTDLKYLTWGVPLTHPRMLDFVKRRMGAHLLSSAYACTSLKSLQAGSDG